MLHKAFLNGFADLMNLASSTLAAVLLARLFGPYLWGQYSQVLWLIGLATVVFSLGLPLAAARYVGALSETHSPERRRVILFLMILQIALALLAGLLLSGGSAKILAISGWRLPLNYLHLASAGVIALLMSQMSLAILRGLQDFTTLALYAALQSSAVLVSLGVVYFYPTIETIILTTVVIQLGGTLWALSRIGRHLGGSYPFSFSFASSLPSEWRAILSYCGTVFIVLLADQIVWQRSEMFFLAQLSDASQSGYYSLAYTLGGVGIGLFANAVTGVLMPALSSLTYQHTWAEAGLFIRRMFSYLAMLVLPLAIGLSVLATPLIELVYGPSFLPVVPILRVLAFSTIVSILSRPAAMVLHVLGKPHLLLVGGLLAIPVDLLLAYWLTPQWGAIGAALANLVAQGLAGGIALTLAWRVGHLSLDGRSLLNSAFSAVGCGLAAGAVIWLIPAPAIGLPLAVAAGGITYLAMLLSLGDPQAWALLARLRASTLYTWLHPTRST